MFGKRGTRPLPPDPGADPLIEAGARAEVQAARKNLMRALRLIDGSDLPKRRSDARLAILGAVAEVEEAHMCLGGSEQGE